MLSDRLSIKCILVFGWVGACLYMLVLTNGGSIQLQFRPNHHNYRQTVKYKTQMILIKVIGFFLEIVVYCMDFNNEVVSRSYILSRIR